MERIIIAHGESKELAKIFQVSLPTIRKALRGLSSSSLALKIRKTALERGGVLMKEII